MSARFFIRDGYGTWYAGDDTDAALDLLIEAGATCLGELEAGCKKAEREFAIVRIEMTDAEVAALPSGHTPLLPGKQKGMKAE